MFDIFVVVLVFVAGMVTAWNAVKQPVWVERLYYASVDGVKDLYNNVKKKLAKK